MKSGISILEFTTNVLNINWQTFLQLPASKLSLFLLKTFNKSSSTASKSFHSRLDTAQNRSLCCERDNTNSTEKRGLKVHKLNWFNDRTINLLAVMSKTRDNNKLNRAHVNRKI